jgi:hypothetical protein
MVAHPRLFPTFADVSATRLSATRSRDARRGRPARPAGSATPAPPPPGRPASTPTPRRGRASPGADQTWPARRRRAAAPRRRPRDAVRHLAGAAGEVEGALAGDTRSAARARSGSRPPRRRGRCRLAGGAEQQQREAEPAGRAGPLLQGGPAVGAAAKSCSQPSTTGSRPRSGPSAGRTSWSRRTGRSAGCRRRSPRPGRRPASRARAGARSTVGGDAGQAGRAGVEGTSAVAPSAASRPAPPSVVPLPPSPTTTVVAPGVDRGQQQLPHAVRVVARSASSPPVRCRPHACALSTYAVSPTSSTVAGSARRTARGRSRPAARRRARRAARRRSRGRRRPSAPGRARRRARRRPPSAIAAAASTAVRVPANLSGCSSSATTTSATRSCSSPTSPATRSSSPATRPGAPRGRVHRLLRRALHGRVGRHPHRRPPEGDPARPRRRLLDGRHGRHRRRSRTRGTRSPTRRHRRPSVVPVTYMNSSADIKAFCGEHGGAVCTSSNAEPRSSGPSEGDKVLFFPDQHLGRNTGAARWAIPSTTCVVWDPRQALGGNTEQLKDARMILWKGHCSVHGASAPSTSTRSARGARTSSCSSTPSAARGRARRPTSSARPSSSSRPSRPRPPARPGRRHRAQPRAAARAEHPDKNIVFLDKTSATARR